MSINVKKYTKEQMAKMVEEAAERLESLRSENADLAERLKKETAEKIALRNDLMAKAHSVEELKADLDASKAASKLLNDQGQEYWRAWQASKREVADLKNKLNDTEAALGRVNAEITYSVTEKNELNAKIKQLDGERHYYKSRSDELDHYKNLLRNANEECARIRAGLEKTRCDLEDWEQRSVWQFNHPWRNLWAWVKRKLKMA